MFQIGKEIFRNPLFLLLPVKCEQPVKDAVVIDLILLHPAHVHALPRQANPVQIDDLARKVTVLTWGMGNRTYSIST